MLVEAARSWLETRNVLISRAMDEHTTRGKLRAGSWLGLSESQGFGVGARMVGPRREMPRTLRMQL